jgi:hypothetical protein
MCTKILIRDDFEGTSIGELLWVKKGKIELEMVAIYFYRILKETSQCFG